MYNNDNTRLPHGALASVHRGVRKYFWLGGACLQGKTNEWSGEFSLVPRPHLLARKRVW